MVCPPEYVIFKPTLDNDLRWIVEFIDPPTQGVYKTIYFDCSHNKESILSSIKNTMIHLYESVGLEY